MKITKGVKSFPHTFNRVLARALIVAGFLFALTPRSHAVSMGPGPGGTNFGPAYIALDSWAFSQNNTNWTSNKGYAPVSFTNLAYSPLGDWESLVVNSTNPAWLQYNVKETNGATNLTVDAGSVMFWFAPSWSGTNQGGTGPGEYGRLLEAGAYTTNSSFGWWSLYVDPAGANLYFSAQTNDSSGTVTTYLVVPIAWTTNYFHFVALTYCATNTALYLDGVLATNGPPLTVYPGQDVLANGFFIGSDSNGIYQAQGLFNNVVTYNVPLDAGTIQSTFNQEYGVYTINPYNTAMVKMISADSSPSFTANSYSAITGAGYLQWVANADVPYGSNACDVWITSTMATTPSNGVTSMTFTIAGGLDYSAYDAFVTGYLQTPLTDSIWVWLGQGFRGNTYTVNIPSVNAFLILGTPWDSNGDGITDTYSRLVAHIDPDAPAQSDAYGVPYAWYIQNGLSVSSALLDPDLDGLVNYKEYLYGTRPKVSEGFGVWTTGGQSSIP
jgi:hypothetical protein